MSDITQISLNGSVYNLRDKQFRDGITNCITEIPQDIKLELSSGTLTLKAGSKLYKPNGLDANNNKVFDIINITSDKTAPSVSGYGTQKVFLFYNYTTNALNFQGIPLVFSGDTAPTGFVGNYAEWYDTAENYVKRTADAGVTWNPRHALPLAIVQITNNVISSIDQVFNGFGYIGSTAFILPGVKGLIPNGRNTDGTLKNTVMNVTAVQTRTYTGTVEECFFLNVSGLPGYFTAITVAYDAEKNINYRVSNNEKLNNGIFGVLTLSSGQITSFSPKYAFHAVDYNDGNYIAHCAMPSDKYVDLTLSTSGTSYTAPADGYFTLIKISGAGDERIQLYVASNNVSSSATSTATGQGLRAFVPVKKGDNVVILYSATGATNTFRFVYANGAK